MSTTTLGTSRPAATAEAVQAKAATRLLFVDNIRVFLTILLTFRPFLIIRYQLAQMAERTRIQGHASVAKCVVGVARVP
jgi:hypothetical protein